MERTNSVKILAIAVAILAVADSRTNAQVIPSSRTIDWTQTGVRGGIPVRTNQIDVTQSPYNADNSGHSDATSAIQSAIDTAKAGQVVYLPDGRYLIAGSLHTDTSGITIRGNTNTTLIGVGSSGDLLIVGHPGDVPDAPEAILSGAAKGSTTVILTATPAFAVGNIVTIVQSDVTLGTAEFPIINVHQYDGNISQQEIVTAISGNTVTLSDPLIWNFTNSPVMVPMIGGITSGIGLENLILTMTNSATGDLGAYPFAIWLASCHDCWVTNCQILYSHAYAINVTSSSHISMIHNTIRYSQGSGSNHSGLVSSSTSGSLFADNIFADGLQPAIEFNGGFCGNVMFANFLTNNIIDIDNHGPHPMMNLWEENVQSGTFEMDGYYGSGSHQTLFRNAVGSTYIPLLFKRWTTHMNVVGNLLGDVSTTYPQYTSEVNNPVGAMIVQFGYPNIGNNTFNGVTNAPWNYPMAGAVADNSGQVYPSGIYTFPSDQAATTNLLGNFSYVSQRVADYGPGAYTLQFQDNVNTNLYYPTNWPIVYPKAGGTATNLLINAPFAVKAGWTVFVSGQNAYQQLQSNDKYSHLITGNYDYYNHAVMWDTNGVQTLPTSLIYTNGAPSWWGGVRWPAVDPTASPLTVAIPAQLRYSNIQTPGSIPGGSVVAPSQLKAIGPAH